MRAYAQWAGWVLRGHLANGYDTTDTVILLEIKDIWSF